MNQVTQRDARLHLALETNQYRLRHVQRHNASGCGEGDQAGTGREGDAHREAGVRITAGTDSVRQQHAVQPAVDDAVARTQGNAAAGHDEVRQGVMRGDVDRLRISGCVAERLHDQISREAQASQVFQLVAGHWASGVLGANGGHLRFAIGARTDAFAFRQTAGATDHLLCQGKALVALGGGFWLLEQVRRAHVQLGTCLFGQAATNDQRNTTASANFVEQDIGLQLECSNQLIAAVAADFAFVGVDINDVAHCQIGAIELDRQCAGVFHSVVEDWRNLGAEAETAGTLVRHVRDVVAEEPQHRVSSGLTRRAGTDHVTHIGDWEAFGGQFFHLLERTNRARNVGVDAVASHLQHGQCVQRDVRARPGVRSWRQIVGVGFAGDLEYGQGDFFGNRGAVLEPLAFSPGLQDGFGVRVASLGFLCNVVERVEHQQGVLQLFCGSVGKFWVVEQVDQRDDVITTLHGAQQFNSVLLADQRRGGFALGDSGEESSLDIGGFVHACGNAVGDQVEEELFFAGWRVFQEFDQACGLLGVQRLGHDALSGTLFYVFAIGFKHSFIPSSLVPWVSRDAHPEAVFKVLRRI